MTMPASPRYPGALLLCILLTACATKAPPAYIAATNLTVRASAEEVSGSTPAHLIYIENGSTVPITVYSITLRSCENVKGSCDSPTPINVRIPGGRRAMIRRVEPRNAQLGFTYRYSYGWRSDSSRVAALAVLANEGSEAASEQIAAIERAEAAHRAEVDAHDEWLPASTISALGSRAAAIRVEPDSFVLRVGEAVTLDRIRLLVIDSAGRLVGRSRFSFGFQPGVVAFVRPDSLKAVTPGRSIIEVKLPLEATVGQARALPPGRLVIVVRP